MAEDLKLRVITDGDTRGLDKTARALDGLADDADRAGASTKGLGEEVDKTSKKTEGLGQKSKKTEHDVVSLDGRINQLKSSLKALGAELERDAGNKDLLRKFRSDSREMQGLERTRKQISGLTDDVKSLGREAASSGGTFASVFQGGLMNFLKTPAGAAVGTTLAVPAAIGIGANAGGLVGAGIGAGVAGAGIAGAAVQSQAVRDEWSRTIGDIKAQWLDATKGFEGPTLSAIKSISAAVRGIDMKKIFGDASKFVEPLAHGIASAVTSIGRGVESIVSKAGPEIKALGSGFAEVGRGIESALSDIAGGSKGGAEALGDLFHAITIVIEGTGKFIGWMEDAYHAVGKLGDGIMAINPIAERFDRLWHPQTVGVLSGELDHTADSVRGLSGALSDMTSQTKIANDAFDRLFGIMMDVDTANLRAKQGMADLAKTAREGGATHDEITEKVQRQIQVLEDQRKAQLATGDGSQAATDRINANYRSQLEQIKAMFPWLAALINKYEELAKPLTKKIEIVISEKRIGNVSVEGVISGGDQRRNAGKAYASGTPSAPPGWALVGEDGPELVNFSGGEQVYTAGQTSRMLSGATGGSSTSSGQGGGRTVTFAGNTDSAFATAFMQMVREGLITID